MKFLEIISWNLDVIDGKLIIYPLLFGYSRWNGSTVGHHTIRL